MVILTLETVMTAAAVVTAGGDDLTRSGKRRKKARQAGDDGDLTALSLLLPWLGGWFLLSHSFRERGGSTSHLLL